MVNIFPSRRIVREAIDERRVAVAFDAITGLPQFKLGMMLFTAKALSNGGRGRAIDIGCGGGRLVLALAKAHPFSEVVGLDLSSEMLRLAGQRALKTGLGERVSFKVGDAQRIPFPDESFDLAVSTLSLHHWSQPVEVFDEVARILRPDGKCLLADLRRDCSPFLVGLVWFVTHFVVPPALRRIREPLGSLESAYTAEEASRLLSKSDLGKFCKVSGHKFWIAVRGRKK